MTRNRFLFLLVIGPLLIGLLFIAMDRLQQSHRFNSHLYMLLSVCVYLPMLTFLRSRYLRIPLKEFLLSLIPLFGYRRHEQLFRKP
jgi:hypothetical protein